MQRTPGVDDPADERDDATLEDSSEGLEDDEVVDRSFPQPYIGTEPPVELGRYYTKRFWLYEFRPVPGKGPHGGPVYCICDPPGVEQTRIDSGRLRAAGSYEDCLNYAEWRGGAIGLTAGLFFAFVAVPPNVLIALGPGAPIFQAWVVGISVETGRTAGKTMAERFGWCQRPECEPPYVNPHCPWQGCPSIPCPCPQPCPNPPCPCPCPCPEPACPPEEICKEGQLCEEVVL